MQHLHFIPDGRKLTVNALSLLFGLIKPLLVNEGSGVALIPENIVFGPVIKRRAPDIVNVARQRH